MRHSKLVGLLLLAMLMAFSSAASAMPQAHLQLWSQRGDYIGQGKHFDITYTPENSEWFSAYWSPDGSGRPDYLTFLLGTVTGGDDNTFATLAFSTAQIPSPMQPGLYLRAERAPFESFGHPGLDVSFQNRGCNLLTGAFRVSEASFGADGVIAAFNATFVQHCEDMTPALFGRFSYSAEAPPVPEPATLALFGAGLCIVALVGATRRERDGVSAAE